MHESEYDVDFFAGAASQPPESAGGSRASEAEARVVEVAQYDDPTDLSLFVPDRTFADELDDAWFDANAVAVEEAVRAAETARGDDVWFSRFANEVEDAVDAASARKADAARAAEVAAVVAQVEAAEAASQEAARSRKRKFAQEEERLRSMRHNLQRMHDQRWHHWAKVHDLESQRSRIHSELDSVFEAEVGRVPVSIRFGDDVVESRHSAAGPFLMSMPEWHVPVSDLRKRFRQAHANEYAVLAGVESGMADHHRSISDLAMQERALQREIERHELAKVIRKQKSRGR